MTALTAARIADAFSIRKNVRAVFVPPEGHLHPLDGLRALSVLWVMLFHAAWFGRTSMPLPDWYALVLRPWMLPIWRGDFGVDLFFVLSGFLIGGMLLDEHARTGRIAVGRFYARRLLRLWPALLVLTFVERLLDHPTRGMLWANALYLNDMVPVSKVALGWTWSLAIEEQFYLVCPWVLRRVAKQSPPVRALAMVLLLVLLVAIARWVVIVAGIFAFDAEIIGATNPPRWEYAFDIFYDKPWMRGGALVAGVLAAILYRMPRVMGAIGRGGLATALGLLASVLLMAVATHWPLFLGAPRPLEVAYLASFRTVFALGAAFVMLTSLSTHPLGQAIARPLSSRWLFPFAQLAYASYLVNPMVTLALSGVLLRFVSHGQEPMHVLVPCDLVATLVCAFALHVLVERPGMALRPRAPLAKPPPPKPPPPNSNAFHVFPPPRSGEG